MINTVSIRNVGRTNEKCSQYIHLNQTTTCAVDETTMSFKFDNLGSDWVLQDSGEAGVIYMAARERGGCHGAASAQCMR